MVVVVCLSAQERENIEALHEVTKLFSECSVFSKWNYFMWDLKSTKLVRKGSSSFVIPSKYAALDLTDAGWDVQGMIGKYDQMTRKMPFNGQILTVVGNII